MSVHLAGYSLVTVQPVAWGDMDAFQHVSNIVYFRYFQDARVEYFLRLGWWDYLDQTGIGPIVHSISARYRQAVTFPDTLIVGTRVLELGDDRFRLHHRLVSQKTGEITTEGETTVVCFHYQQQTKYPLPEVIRNKLLAIENNPALLKG